MNLPGAPPSSQAGLAKGEPAVNRSAVGSEIGRRGLLMIAAASILVKWGATDARAATMTGNVILLGDSILDNAAYVPRGADVVAHLNRRLPTDWSATLL